MSLQAFLNLLSGEGQWTASHPRRFNSREKSPIYPLDRRLGMITTCPTLRSIKETKPIKQKSNIFDKNDIYKLICAECPARYIGQRERIFKPRYKEYIQGIII
jgi:hypothetical protein